MRENSLCWYCAFISTGIYIWIFGDVSLYMESALNAYYMVMAVYGWYQWQRWWQ
jgi:nicotinamide mononucleotide transporter